MTSCIQLIYEQIPGRHYSNEQKQPFPMVSTKYSVNPFKEVDSQYKLPFYGCRVSAGFPSPADDYIETYLDLNTHLVKHPAATFFLTASGDSMINAGISSGDILVVDRSLDAVHGKIIIAAVDGELTVKRLYKQNGKIQLIPENPKYLPIEVGEGQDLVIWGVVTYILRCVN